MILGELMITLPSIHVVRQAELFSNEAEGCPQGDAFEVDLDGRRERAIHLLEGRGIDEDGDAGEARRRGRPLDVLQDLDERRIFGERHRNRLVELCQSLRRPRRAIPGQDDLPGLLRVDPARRADEEHTVPDEVSQAQLSEDLRKRDLERSSGHIDRDCRRQALLHLLESEWVDIDRYSRIARPVTVLGGPG